MELDPNLWSRADKYLHYLSKVSNNILGKWIFPSAMTIIRTEAIIQKGSKRNHKRLQVSQFVKLFNKIFERLLHKQQNKFLSKHKLLFRYPLGFGSKHFTSNALINIPDHIKDLIYMWKYVLARFLEPKNMLTRNITIFFSLNFKSLGPSDDILKQRSGSTLAQEMACCLMTPSHYPNHWWHIFKEIM